jgi:hypothetical protein
LAQTADQARASAIPVPVNTPQTGSPTSGTTSDFTDFLTTISKSPALVSGYSKLLKSAGYYKGKITSKYSLALQKALTAAEQDRAELSAITPIGRDEFLKQKISEGTGTGTGTGQPSVVEDITAYTPEAAKMLIESVIRDTLGRKATAAEIAKYTSNLKKIQQQAASITTYKTVGGKQTRVTTPGISEQQYLVDQVSGSDEGKANKVLGFYETFMNALGGR